MAFGKARSGMYMTHESAGTQPNAACSPARLKRFSKVFQPSPLAGMARASEGSMMGMPSRTG